MKTDTDFISPNYDGYNDFLKFSIEWKNPLRLKNWVLSITDESGKIVKTFQADTRHKRRKNFLLYLFSDNNQLEPLDIPLPNSILWLGTDFLGKVLPDGKYTCNLSLTTDSDRELTSTERVVFLDSVYPKAEVKIDQKYFSPNKDKIQDTLNIKHTIKGSYEDKWQGIFLNDKNEVVKTYQWDTKNVPFSLNWDGRNDRGILLDNGTYTYQFTGEDKAQNKIHIQINGIVLNQEMKSIDIQSNLPIFSPNAQNKENLPVFTPIVPPRLKLDHYKFLIFKKKSKEEEIIYESNGERIPDEFTWNLKNQADEILQDGVYFYKLEIQSDGFLVSSYEKTFSIDSKRIKTDFSFSSKNFTPDGDGEDDFLEIRLKIYNRKIHSWNLYLIEKYIENGKMHRTKLKSWTGLNNPSDTIVWDGLSDEGILVGSLSQLELEFTGIDDLNEEFFLRSENFATGILAVMNNSSIRISVPEGKILESESRYLKQIKSILSYYPGYKVEIQSHASQPGDNHENLLKTENRARNIFEKLYEKKFFFNRFSFRGIGEVEPLLLQINDYAFFKNNRIDILLFK
ncbi:MAG: OmpA family protein [Leptospiraceae bacterium]|nr:hypothetical protein [Leptospiraceae bacterium]MCK6381268.1 OmpA family protein [Leptospiraceae bacterium]NUM42708.1 hypothetical protein [Leptospiraceae bacterium]